MNRTRLNPTRLHQLTVANRGDGGGGEGEMGETFGSVPWSNPQPFHIFKRKANFSYIFNLKLKIELQEASLLVIFR